VARRPQVERVAQRYELRSQLGGVDSGQLRNHEHVALARAHHVSATAKTAPSLQSTKRAFLTRFSATCVNASRPSSTRAEAAAVRCAPAAGCSAGAAAARNSSRTSVGDLLPTSTMPSRPSTSTCVSEAGTCSGTRSGGATAVAPRPVRQATWDTCQVRSSAGAVSVAAAAHRQRQGAAKRCQTPQPAPVCARERSWRNNATRAAATHLVERVQLQPADGQRSAQQPPPDERGPQRHVHSVWVNGGRRAGLSSRQLRSLVCPPLAGCVATPAGRAWWRAARSRAPRRAAAGMRRAPCAPR
jgi:hypothetical protein